MNRLLWVVSLSGYASLVALAAVIYRATKRIEVG